MCPERDVGAALVLRHATGWPDSRCLDAPVYFTLLALPGSSPEPNPVEKVWQ